MRTINLAIICLIACFFSSCHDSDPHDYSSLDGTRWINYSRTCLDGNTSIPFVNEFTLEPEVYSGTLIEFNKDGSVDVYSLDKDNKIERRIGAATSYLVKEEGTQVVFSGIDGRWVFEIESKDLMVKDSWTVWPAFYIDPLTGELSQTTRPGEEYERTSLPLSFFIRSRN